MIQNVVDTLHGDRKLWLSESLVCSKGHGVIITPAIPLFGEAEHSLYQVHVKFCDDLGFPAFDVVVGDTKLIFYIRNVVDSILLRKGTVDLPGEWWTFDYYLSCYCSSDTAQITLSLWR